MVGYTDPHFFPVLFPTPFAPPQMASSYASVLQFIETALACTGPFELSYTDPDQRWHIREDLLSLVQEFPCFNTSMDAFTHNDGTVVNLLCANADLEVSYSRPLVPLTIWVHENYPYVSPMVFVDMSRLGCNSPINCNHPFVDPCSGLTTPPYVQTWEFPRSNLRDLIRNIVNIFSRDHPILSPVGSGWRCAGSNRPSYVSRTEAIDRLAGVVHCDMTSVMSETDAEIEGLLQLQRELAERTQAVDAVIDGLELERQGLRKRIRDSNEATDILANWLKVHNHRGLATASFGVVDVDNLFEAADEESEMRVQCLAMDKSLEDTIYALDEAVSNGVLDFEDYIRQVRMLAREQFSYRAMLLKLKKNNHFLQRF